MLKAIMKREFEDNILNLRFSVGLILCMLVTISCVMILCNDYQQEMKDYTLRIAMQDDFLNNYAHTNRLGGMIIPQKPPEQFRPLVIGVPKDADVGSFDDNPLSVLFPPIDLLFIVTIIMSLLAILFSYDSVAGEKEKGTLKLMISNSLSRAHIIVGKWSGGTASLLIPFVFSLGIGALYIVFHPRIQWDGAAWMVFILLILASVIFISIFYLLGLLVSSFSRSSSASILTSLFIWVLFILVIPNLSPYISAQLYSIPSVNRIEKEVNRLRGIERDNLGNSLVAEINSKYEAQYGQMFVEYLNMDAEARRSRVAIDSQFKEMMDAYRSENNQAWSEANRIQGEKANRLRENLRTKAAIQTKIAKFLACISPYSNYIYLATDLTGTGLRSLDYFGRLTSEYYSVNQPYLTRKVREATEKDPTFNSNSFIDLSDRPRFEYREEAIESKVTAVLPYFGVLMFFTALFFVVAFIGFLRYDVR